MKRFTVSQFPMPPSLPGGPGPAQPAAPIVHFVVSPKNQFEMHKLHAGPRGPSVGPRPPHPHPGGGVSDQKLAGVPVPPRSHRGPVRPKLLGVPVLPNFSGDNFPGWVACIFPSCTIRGSSSVSGGHPAQYSYQGADGGFPPQSSCSFFAVDV